MPPNDALICKSHVKRYILQRTKKLRPGFPCSRVSTSAIVGIDTSLRAIIDNLIKTHPTMGKTFLPFERFRK